MITGKHYNEYTRIRLATRMLIITTLWLLRCISHTHARQETKIMLHQPDSAAIMSLILRADSVSKTSRAESNRLFNLARSQAAAAGYRYGSCMALAYQGRTFMAATEWDSAIYYLNQALPYLRDPDIYQRKAAALYNNLANCYLDAGRYTLCLRYLNLALQALGNGSHTNRTTDSAGVYGNMATMFLAIREFKAALGYLEKARVLAVAHKDTTRLSMVYHNLGYCYQRQWKWEESAAWYRKALDLEARKHITHHLIYTLSSLASAVGKAKHYDEADSLLKIAMAMSDTADITEDTRQMPLVTQATLLLDRKQYHAVLKILPPLYESAVKRHSTVDIGKLGRQMSTLYAGLGDYQKAYQFLTAERQEGEMNHDNEQNDFMQLWSTLLHTEKDKMVLSQKLLIAHQRNQLQQKNSWIAGIVLGTLLLLAVALIIIRSYRHRQALQYSVIRQMEQTQEINQLRAQVRGEEQERERIARELHDNIASQLWAIRLQVGCVQKQDYSTEQHSEHLGMIYRQLTEASQDIRHTAHNLLPDLLLEEGLSAALAQVCRKVNDTTELDVAFLEYGQVPRLEETIELSIYRMVQELIQNVMKHATGATTLLVQLSCADLLLNITVEDNGCGFACDAAKEGMGLRQIRKRVAALKGHFDLQSTPGQGTTLYLEFELHHFI